MWYHVDAHISWNLIHIWTHQCYTLRVWKKKRTKSQYTPLSQFDRQMKYRAFKLLNNYNGILLQNRPGKS